MPQSLASLASAAWFRFQAKRKRGPTEWWWIKLRSKSDAMPQAIHDFLREISDPDNGVSIQKVIGMDPASTRPSPGMEHVQEKGYCIMIQGRVQADAQTVKKILETYNFGDDWKVRVGGWLDE